MFNQDRLKSARKKRLLLEKDASATRIKITKLQTELRAALQIRGSIPQKANWCLRHAATILEKERIDDVVGLVKTWYKSDPAASRLPYADKAAKFYYFMKDGRLSEEDEFVMTAYQLVAEYFFGRVELLQSSFKGKGIYLIDRIQTWLGDNCGNQIEDTLIDYFKAVFAAIRDFKPALVHKPSSALGDYGWSTFLDWVEHTHGGRQGYLLPTKEAQNEANQQQDKLSKIIELRQLCLAKGRIDLYDKLGRTDQLEVIQQILKEL